MRKIVFTLLSAILFSVVASGQIKKADNYFNQWDFYSASQLYKRAIDKHPTAYAYFKLGECYRKIAMYKEAAAAFDKVNSYGFYHGDPEFYLYYGWMLNSNDRCDEARKAFTRYDSLVPKDPRGKMFMGVCEKEAEDHKGDLPIEVVEVTRLNTNGSDFSPVVYKDGIVFTSDRSDVGQKDLMTGRGVLKLYYAQRNPADPTDFTQAVGFDNTINVGITGPACFSKNEDTIYYSRVSVPEGVSIKGNIFEKSSILRNKIYSSVLKDGKWVDETPFYLNSDSFSVTHPYLSRDGSKLYFSSDMPGGYGSSDIYYCKREGDKWGKAINMGPNINTVCREGFPTLDSAGNLYFSSEGYSGSGGYNICVSKLVNGVYQKANTLKYPFNSSGDDFGLTFLKDGKTGYFSSNRSDGNDDDDIYYFDLGSYKDLVTSEYTIGYKPPPAPVAKSLDKSPGNSAIPFPVIPHDVDYTLYIGFQIYFDFDKAKIRDVDEKTLKLVTAYMKNDTSKQLQINGNTDPKGSSNYNQVLSQARAHTALEYLVSKGIERKRIGTAGFGFNNLILKENVYDEKRELINRRDDLLIQLRPGDSTVTKLASPIAHDSVKVGGNNNLRYESNSPAHKPASDNGKSSFIEKNNSAKNLVFDIQLGAFKKPVSKRIFHKYSPIVAVKGHDGYIHYYTGRYKKFESAKKALSKVQQSGCSGAFIAAIYNGKRISMEKLAKLGVKYNPVASIQDGGNNSIAKR